MELAGLYMHTPLVTRVRIPFDSLTTSKDSMNIHLVIRTHQGRLVRKDYRAAALPEILRKFQLNI